MTIGMQSLSIRKQDFLILGKFSSPEGLSNTGRGCPGKWLSHHPWRYLKDV